ncbi:family 43 glycosylhydrolase [Membranicola marinus]|uniref:Family 43 glycosylhydrolase n=1 Tax=Membranihabitans marinus TaxID=1227546 RepID=A0A953L9H8_9BACT|nr:family 43 glycosylhydrolase [Membranihabitans marinus]MBY5956666.1 family 43 glycosylhydrolase [Membranihabitans marinus]
MYTGSGFRDWEIGDIEVFKMDDTYHLFHLIIPNHDYIAHAVSKDGYNWRRVKNALFVGHPGEWDDDMLWTMDVSEGDGVYEMYYTGLKLSDKGTIQKIGRAKSHNLYDWEKENNYNFPLTSLGPYYENLDNNPRTWLSFRDPYRFTHEGSHYLLFCGRSSHGPISRRGCVGLAKLEDEEWVLKKPLLFPIAYDDVECPCIVQINDRFYLLGSIREDIKVRYWYSDEFQGPYLSFHSDVLMPQGNYAARIIQDNEHVLIYNFYYLNREINYKRVLPPPKEVAVDQKGRLYLKSFYGWENNIQNTIYQPDFADVIPTFKNSTASMEIQSQKWTFQSISGYEAYAFQKPADNFIWEGELHLEGMGKSGFVLNIDEDGNGYFISMDFVNGYVQIRRWGFNPDDYLNNFKFDNLQTGLFKPSPDRKIQFRLIRYGYYIELSIDDRVILTLVDYQFEGDLIGLYSASSILSMSNSRIHILGEPETEYAVKDSD